MPRRRKTKAMGSSRPKPNVPGGDIEQDYKDEVKQEKLNMLLKDFDKEVETRIKQMEEAAGKMYAQTENAIRVELLKIPKDIQQMPVTEFLAMGGIVDATSIAKVTQVAIEMISSVAAPPLQPITEEAEDPESTVKKKRPTRGRKALQANSSINVPPPSTVRKTRKMIRSSQQPMITPKAKGIFHLDAATPLVTPMFDRRLPKTPATLVRNARPGEQMLLTNVQVSMSGSPVIGNKSTKPEMEMLVPVCKGKKTLVLREDTEAEEILEGLDISPHTMKQLSRMKDLLSNIVDHSALTSKK